MVSSALRDCFFAIVQPKPHHGCCPSGDGKLIDVIDRHGYFFVFRRQSRHHGVKDRSIH